MASCPAVTRTATGGLWRAVAIAVGTLSAVALQAAPIVVPNGSFESPSTPFADPRIDAWQKSPKPVWFEENEAQKWDQLTGVFVNTAPGAADHIDNMDGSQAIFLFALPEAALFQDYDSTDWSNSTPTHAFDAVFEVGKSYRLTVGAVGGGGGMVEGASLLAALYYRDAASNIVMVAGTNIVHSPALFTNTTHFVDFPVEVPEVQAGDAWANQHIGIQLLSTVAPDKAAGYWDIDNVRLTEEGGAAAALTLANPSVSGGVFSLTVQSAPGINLEILAAENIALPLSEWTTVGH